ncbi:MAG: helix-turn-helix domain-containing protein [Bdellovibrionales bacterium]|nr:helix-turn-helix domain-containing protein [Bdellovibrionales bacterium]
MKLSDNLVKIDQLSNALGIPKSTIYYLVHRRRIPHYKVGGALRFNLDEVLKHYPASADKILINL